MAVNSATCKDGAPFEAAPPFLFADYYDRSLAYLVGSLDSETYVVMDGNTFFADQRLAGQAILTKDQKLIAVYSLHKSHVDDCYVPKFSSSCLLRIGSETFDLQDSAIEIQWIDGFIRRTFRVLRDSKVVHEHSYLRHWRYELFVGTSDQNLQGQYDFFAYVIWAAKRSRS